MRNQLRRFERTGSFLPTFFNHYFNDDSFSNLVNGNIPATNVSEDENTFSIELSVPGFKKEDINIEIEKDVLKISAQTEEKKEETEEKFWRREFKKSSFTRSFSIPENVDAENIIASQKDGILQITMPKIALNEGIRIKKIDIK